MSITKTLTSSTKKSARYARALFLIILPAWQSSFARLRLFHLKEDFPFFASPTSHANDMAFSTIAPTKDEKNSYEFFSSHISLYGIFHGGISASILVLCLERNTLDGFLHGRDCQKDQRKRHLNQNVTVVVGNRIQECKLLRETLGHVIHPIQVSFKNNHLLSVWRLLGHSTLKDKKERFKNPSVLEFLYQTDQ